MLLGSGGRSEEGSQNVGGAAAIWAINYANAGVSGHPMWDLIQSEGKNKGQIPINIVLEA